MIKRKLYNLECFQNRDTLEVNPKPSASSFEEVQKWSNPILTVTKEGVLQACHFRGRRLTDIKSVGRRDTLLDMVPGKRDHTVVEMVKF